MILLSLSSLSRPPTHPPTHPPYQQYDNEMGYSTRVLDLLKIVHDSDK